MGQKLSKGIIYIMVANILGILLGVITNFVLPKYLSISTYAAIKTYRLYMNYAGVLSLGFVDGMYLKYGGKNIESLNQKELSSNLSTMRVMQLCVIGVVLLFGILKRDVIIIFFALSVLPFNMAGYFKQLYQAVGEFQKYSNTLNATSFFVFFANIFLLFFVRTDQYYLYLAIYFLIYALIWLWLEIKIRPYMKQPGHFNVQQMIDGIRRGILLMLGNLSSILLTSMDCWFVKFFLTTVDFAQYLFAVSIEGFLTTLSSPVSVTLYNYFCRVKKRENILQIRSFVMLFSVAIISVAFPVKFILEHYLSEYILASSVLFFLFAAQLFFVIIKSVYVNLYKAAGRQRDYTMKLSLTIISGFLFNIICFCLVGAKESFAVGTLLSAILWFLLSVWDFREYMIEWREAFFLFMELGIFLLCGLYCSALLGMGIYCLISLLLIMILMKNDFTVLMRIVMDSLLEIFKKKKN